MENGVNRFIEISAISKEEQRVKTIARYEKKILRSINWLEKRSEEFISSEISMDQIAVACALDYTNFRFTKDWCHNGKLSKWLEAYNEKEFMKSSKPGVSYNYE